MEIRRCTPSEAKSLTEIAHRSKAHWGYTDHDLRRWRDDLTLDPEWIRSHDVHGVYESGRVTGFYALMLGDTRCELEHFWVDPSRIGYGVGRRLFEHAVMQARTMGAVAIDISSDPHAEGFYLRMGAERVGAVPAPVDDQPARILPRMTFVL